MPLLFLITGVSVIIVMWVGGSMVINEEMTLGEIIAFIAYLSLLDLACNCIWMGY